MLMRLWKSLVAMLARLGRSLVRVTRLYFVAGLLAFAPIGITLWALGWIVTRLDNLLLPRVISWVSPGLDHPPDLPPFVGAIFTFLVILLAGVIVRHFFGHELVRVGERMLLRVPVARTIYGGVKQLFEAVLQTGDTNFNRVVLIEYPRKGLWALAFTTGVARGPVDEALPGQRLVNCFVPTTPNPTSGFYLLALRGRDPRGGHHRRRRLQGDHVRGSRHPGKQELAGLRRPAARAAAGVRLAKKRRRRAAPLDARPSSQGPGAAGAAVRLPTRHLRDQALHPLVPEQTDGVARFEHRVISGSCARRARSGSSIRSFTRGPTSASTTAKRSRKRSGSAAASASITPDLGESRAQVVAAGDGLEALPAHGPVVGAVLHQGPEEAVALQILDAPIRQDGLQALDRRSRARGQPRHHVARGILVAQRGADGALDHLLRDLRGRREADVRHRVQPLEGAGLARRVQPDHEPRDEQHDEHAAHRRRRSRRASGSRRSCASPRAGLRPSAAPRSPAHRGPTPAARKPAVPAIAGPSSDDTASSRETASPKRPAAHTAAHRRAAG